jgi:hypothetical protein
MNNNPRSKTMTTYKMLSDPFLARFKSFMASENRNPAGAFDSALTKAKFRFVPVPHCGGTLFLRERSSNMAYDEATEISDPAKDVLNFLRNKISDDDMAQVEELLKMEAGVKIDSQVEAEQMIAGAKARGAAGAQDAKRRQLALDASAAASDARMADFAARFPGAARIGQV